MKEIQVQSLNQVDPLEKGMATHSSILAWRIPWTEEPGKLQFSSVQFSHLVMSDSVTPWTAAPSFPVFPQLPGLANSCPLSLWCHPSTSSSFVPFSSCPQSFPSSESFQMSQLSTWGSQSIGVSASASFLPMNTQDCSPLGWTGWISLYLITSVKNKRHSFSL